VTGLYLIPLLLTGNICGGGSQHHGSVEILRRDVGRRLYFLVGAPEKKGVKSMDTKINPEDEARDFNMTPCAEPTISELLGDPLTRALMTADRVDVQAFEQTLQAAACRVRAGSGIATQPTLALQASAGAKSDPSIPDYLRWTSVDRISESSAARSMRGAIVQKASRSVCASNCSW
jgi:hypothetical protein